MGGKTFPHGEQPGWVAAPEEEVGRGRGVQHSVSAVGGGGPVGSLPNH